MKSSKPPGHPDPHLSIGQTPATDDAPDPIIERPTGFYWQTPDAIQEFGPFATRALAVADRESRAGLAPPPDEAP